MLPKTKKCLECGRDVYVDGDTVMCTFNETLKRMDDLTFCCWGCMRNWYSRGGKPGDPEEQERRYAWSAKYMEAERGRPSHMPFCYKG